MKFADFESRKRRKNLEWSIQDHIFCHIANHILIAHLPLIYLHQEQIKKLDYAFYVEPDSVGTDAFSFSWQCEFLYAFPPFSIIHTVLRKIENEQGERIKILPLFTTQLWFIRLLRILVSGPLTLPTSKKALYFPYRRKIIPKIPDIKLLAYHVSGNHSKKKGLPEDITPPVVERWH